MIIPRMLLLISLHSLFFGVVVASDSDDTSISSLFETVAALAKQRLSCLTYRLERNDLSNRADCGYGDTIVCQDRKTDERLECVIVAPTANFYRPYGNQSMKEVTDSEHRNLLKKMIRDEELLIKRRKFMTSV